MKQEHERLRQLLADTISLLCKNSLKYTNEVKIEGVLGITIDTDQVFIVHIDDCLRDDVGEYADIATYQKIKMESHEVSAAVAATASDTNLPCYDQNSEWTADDDDDRNQENYDADDDVMCTSVDNRRYTSDAFAVNLYGTDTKRVKSKRGRRSSSFDTPEVDYQTEAWRQNDEIWPEFYQSPSYKHQNQDTSLFDMRPPVGVRKQQQQRPSSAVKRGRGRGVKSPSSFKSEPGINSRHNVQNQDTDGFSYGKLTVTNYVCNICGVSYKHHCNLLTHQVRVHGRQKKHTGRKPAGSTNMANLTV